MSHLRCLEVVVAIATLWAIVSQLRRLPPNVAIATLCLSVGIATLFYKRRYSDSFGRDGKNLEKFPTFGQKRRNQVSEFPPNVVVTRPEIFYVVNQLSQDMVKLTKLFWKAEKHVFRCLKGIIEYGLWYKWKKGVKLQGFTDAD